MNILAHLYFSPEPNEILFGNFIGDFVKGNQYLHYPEKVQQGIKLHRQIDSITDKHPEHLKVRALFRTKYGLHSGIVADIVFDHFLASNWDNFYAEPLTDYSHRVYHYLEDHQKELPPQLLRFMQSMIKNNWLVMYGTLDGLEKILNGMSRNTSLPMLTPYAIDVVNQNYHEINQSLTKLLPDIAKQIKKE